MRPAARRIPVRYFALVGAALVAALALALFIGRADGSDNSITAEALQRVEAKNRNAAIEAAALQRAQSEAEAEAADREADLRDAGNDAAPLTRFETANEAAAR